MFDLSALIKKQIETRVRELVDAEIEETTKRLRVRAGDIAASVAVNVTKYVSMEQQIDRLIITVHIPDEKGGVKL